MASFPLDDVAAFLGRSRTAALATVSPGGDPHVCNVQFVPFEPLELVWASKPTAAHSTHLTTNSRVALAVYGHDDTEPGGIHGVQLRGSASPVPLTEAVWGPYARRFPIAGRMRAAFDEGEQQLYRFRADWVRWIDNRRGFGFKVEQAMDGGGGSRLGEGDR